MPEIPRPFGTFLGGWVEEPDLPVTLSDLLRKEITAAHMTFDRIWDHRETHDEEEEGHWVKKVGGFSKEGVADLC